MIRRMRLVMSGAVAALVGLALLPAGASAAKTPSFLSCGNSGGLGPRGLPKEAGGTIRFLQRPAKCSYSVDGTATLRVTFEQLKWKTWGGVRSTARGRQVVRGKKLAVTVRLGKRILCTKAKRRGWYYRELKISGGPSPGAVRLTLPTRCT